MASGGVRDDPVVPADAGTTRVARGVGHPGYETGREWLLAVLCASCGLALVVPLLAWVVGLGTFSTWFWRISAPALVVLAAVGLFVSRRGPAPVRAALMAGTLGGLLGTALYDLVRLPFVWVGYQLFAPIESYGILLADQSRSLGSTTVNGWAYHVAVGFGFGVAYATIARGRTWPWGVAWALGLESVALASPFASVYDLRGERGLMVLALAAHVPFGIAVGVFAQQADHVAGELERFPKATVSIVLSGIPTVLLLWLAVFARLETSAAPRTPGHALRAPQ